MAENVLVTGGTGKTGRLVAQQLEARGVRPRVASRRPSGCDQIRFDWDDESSFEKALEDVESVYLVAPTNHVDHLEVMRPFLERAVKQVMGRLVLLSASSLERGGPLMGGVHEWLAEHAPSWSALRPSWFMQNFITDRLPAIINDGRILSATQDGRVPFIDASDIAAVATELLTRPDVPSGEHILTGPATLGYDEVAAMISEVTGRSVRHERLSARELAEFYTRMGVPGDYAPALAAMDEAIAAGSENRVTDEVERLTGRKPRSFLSFLQGHRDVFLGGRTSSFVGGAEPLTIG
jgi:ergot alkaloid biosynthesis protein